MDGLVRELVHWTPAGAIALLIGISILRRAERREKARCIEGPDVQRLLEVLRGEYAVSTEEARRLRLWGIFCAILGGYLVADLVTAASSWLSGSAPRALAGLWNLEPILSSPSALAAGGVVGALFLIWIHQTIRTSYVFGADLVERRGPYPWIVATRAVVRIDISSDERGMLLRTADGVKRGIQMPLALQGTVDAALVGGPRA